MSCPLCQSPQPDLLCRADQKRYLHCFNCDLRFLDRQFRLSAEEEKKHYLLHENEINDPGYQRYVEPLVEAVLSRTGARAEGLDYGCGEGPVAAHLLGREGRRVALYDPFFEPDRRVLERRYDFIIVSEVAEHFHNPRAEFGLLTKLLRPNGLLCVMTQIYREGADFGGWYYRRDPTHVCFYSEKTFSWIARSHGYLPPEFSGTRVAVLSRAD